MLFPIVLLLAASGAWGQSVTVEDLADSPPDNSFLGISGLAYDSANGVYYAVSDDSRERVFGGGLNPPLSGPRFFDVNINIPATGQLSSGTPTDAGFVPTPDGNDARVAPEGLEYSDGLLYSADNSESVTSPFNSRLISYYPQILAVNQKYQVPFDLKEVFKYEGMTITQRGADSGRSLYAIVEEPFSYDRRDTVIVDEFDVDSGDHRRAFSYPLTLDRVQDIQWEQEIGSNNYFLVLESSGVDLGYDPQDPAPAYGSAPRPSKVALFECVVEESKNILPGRRDAVKYEFGNRDEPVLFKYPLGEFTLGLSPSGEESLIFTPPPLMGRGPVYLPGNSYTDFAWAGTLPLWDGMTFGPRLESGFRSLILVSDNNGDSSVPTRYLALSYNPFGGVGDQSGPLSNPSSRVKPNEF